MKAQTGGNACSALGLVLPDSATAWQAYDFPQAVKSRASHMQFGVAFAAHPTLPFAQWRQAAWFMQRGAFHTAAYADFFGNTLFGWQQYQWQTGVSMGKWRMGAGAWSRRMHVAEERQWQLNAQLGISGTLHKGWWWHLAFGQLRQPGPDFRIVQGSPPATARLLLEHRPAKGTCLWLMYQQQQGWDAMYGLGLQWKMHPHVCFDMAVVPTNRSLSAGLAFEYQGLRVSIQARHQALPGPWWGNQLQWSGLSP